MLSGDKKEKCVLVNNQIGFNEIFYEKLPEEKLEIVEESNKTLKTAMIGDGINDSPALEQANVSLTFAQSTQIAQSVSDIIIFRGGFEKLNSIFKISKNASRRISENLFLAFIYNIIMIPIAVTGNIVPSMAALAMALSSLSVVINSSRKL